MRVTHLVLHSSTRAAANVSLPPALIPEVHLGISAAKPETASQLSPNLSNLVNVAAAKTTPIRPALTALPSQPRTIPSLPFRPHSKREEGGVRYSYPHPHLRDRSPARRPASDIHLARAQLTLGFSSRRLSTAALRWRPAAEPWKHAQLSPTEPRSWQPERGGRRFARTRGGFRLPCR